MPQQNLFGGVSQSTPQQATGPSATSQLFKALGTGGSSFGGAPTFPTAPTPSASTLNFGAQPALARPTATGGYVIHPAALPQSTTGATLQKPNVEPLSNGGTATFNETGGVNSINASPYSIGTGSVPSTALSSNLTVNDLMNKRNAYADYAQQLYQATIPSNDYLSAVKGLQDAKQGGMQIQADFLTNPQYPGDTYGFAQGVAGRQTALNSLQQNAAANTLNVQQLIRQGNIDAYKSLVSAASPQSLSPGSSLISPLDGGTVAGGLGGYTDIQAAQTYSNLQQQFPDAQIPAYNQSLSPQANLQAAQQAAAQSPSFQSRNLVPVTLPGGGYSFVNKNQLITGPNGQSVIISSANAAQADGFKSTITKLTDQKSQIATSIGTVDNNFPILTNIVQKYKLNTGVPLYNQFSNMADKQLGQTGVYQLSSVVAGLKGTISQIIGAGGTVDDKVRAEADNVLPSNASYSVLQDLYNVIKKEGAGRLKAFDDQITNASKGLNDIYSTGSAPSASNTASTSSGGSLYDF